MTDRRRTPRYVLGTPLSGDALPMEDVTIEDYSPGRMVVICASPHLADEELMIHVTTSNGLHSSDARVLASTPVSMAGALCYRVTLRVNEDPRVSGENAGDEK